MKRFCILAFPAILLLVWGTASQSQTTGSAYKILKKYEIGGVGGWDYLTLDSASRRLYISRSSHVMIMDVDTGRVLGDIPNTKGVHGIAIAPKHKKGFTSNGTDSSVTIFDTETMLETGRVNVGKSPDPIMYDSASDRVFTFNAGSKDATAVDAATGKVVGTVNLGGRPEAGIADEKGMVYVNVMDKAEVVAFDSKDLTVKNHWSVAPGATPVGLGFDPIKNRLYSSCRNDKMVVLDAATGKVLANLPIGKGTDACIFDGKAGLAFSSNSDGTLTIVEEKTDGTFHVQANVQTLPGAKTMALDTKTQNLFLAAVQYKTDAGKKTAVANSFTIFVVGK